MSSAGSSICCSDHTNVLCCQSGSAHFSILQLTPPSPYRSCHVVQCRAGAHVLVRNLALLLTGRLQPAGPVEARAVEAPAGPPAAAAADNGCPFGGLPMAEVSSPGGGAVAGAVEVEVVGEGLTAPYELAAGRYYCIEGCVVLQVRDAFVQWGAAMSQLIGQWRGLGQIVHELTLPMSYHLV
jgi:hypothetical protein